MTRDTPPAPDQGVGDGDEGDGDTASAVPQRVRGSNRMPPTVLFPAQQCSLCSDERMFTTCTSFTQHLKLHKHFWSKKGRCAPLRRAGGCRQRGEVPPCTPLATPHSSEALARRPVLPAIAPHPMLPAVVEVPPQCTAAETVHARPASSMPLGMPGSASTLPPRGRAVTSVTAFTPFPGPQPQLLSSQGGSGPNGLPSPTMTMARGRCSL